MLTFYKTKQNLSPGQIAWRKFSKNISSMFALSWILLWVLSAIAGYLIIPDQTPFANQQNLELAARSPGFKVQMIMVRKNTVPSSQSFFRTMLFGKASDFEIIPMNNYRIEGTDVIISKYTGYPEMAGPELILHIADVAFPVDSIFSDGDNIEVLLKNGKTEKVNLYDLQKIVMTENIVSRTYLLGTDRFGRDLLSQVIIGARVSLSVGFIAICIALLVGILLGSLAGFFRGKTDDFIMWLINVVWSIPTLLLVIAITFALGKGFWQVFIAVGLTMWVDVARVVRGQIISLRENEYIEAARALGLPNLRIIRRHILPNIIGPVVVISAANFASAILIEAGLSFLGIGVQPPMPSWGSMIKENYGYIILDKAYLAVIPGLCIMSLVMAFMMTGNGLRDALDKSPVNY